MSDFSSSTSSCPWCRFHPDTRKVFVFFFILIGLIAMAEDFGEGAKSAAHRAKQQTRVIPMGVGTEKRSSPTEKPAPFSVEKEVKQ